MLSLVLLLFRIKKKTLLFSFLFFFGFESRYGVCVCVLVLQWWLLREKKRTNFSLWWLLEMSWVTKATSDDRAATDDIDGEWDDGRSIIAEEEMMCAVASDLVLTENVTSVN
jgi:hypothetical protein